MYNVAEVGARLKGLREDKRMSQYELADAIGISRESIARYETGKRGLSVDVLDLYAQYFEKSADYFLYGEKKENSLTVSFDIDIIVRMLGKVPEEMQDMVYSMVMGMLEKIVCNTM